MKIATLANADVVHSRRWASWFRGRGHDVRLWSLEEGPAGFACDRLPSAPLPGFVRYPLAVPALRRALAGFAPDVVDAHYVPNYGFMAALAGASPLVVSAWGSDLLIKGAADPLQAWRARFTLSRARAVIADGDNLARAAEGLGGGERVHMIPWGVDTAMFRAGPDRDPGLLLSTRMHEEIYDIPSLIRGARPVLAAHPEAFLAIAGTGSLTPQLERLAAHELPAGRHRFLGRLEPAEMASWLGRAGVFLSASHSDSTSLSLLEAMAAGAVPVVSAIDGNAAWVGDGEGARTFRPGDSEAVTHAILAAISDATWAAAARQRNRRVVEERGDAARNMVRIEALLERVASGK